VLAESDMLASSKRRGVTPVSGTRTARSPSKSGLPVRRSSPTCSGDGSNDASRKNTNENSSECDDSEVVGTPRSSWQQLLRSSIYLEKIHGAHMQKASARKLGRSAVLSPCKVGKIVADGVQYQSSADGNEKYRRISPVRKMVSPERNWREAHRALDQTRSEANHSPVPPCRDVLAQQTHATRQRESSAATERERRESPTIRKERSTTPQLTPRREVRSSLRDRPTSSRMSLGRKMPEESRRSLGAKDVGASAVFAPMARLSSPRVQSQQSYPTISACDGFFDSLAKQGFLSDSPTPCTYAQGPTNPDSVEVTNDLKQVRDLFSAQMPDVSVFGVWRIENRALSGVYRAVCDSMGAAGGERSLWHGTSLGSIRNITLNGFNRAYCGRHGMKFGHGTYFSAAADYSVRFCDRRSAQRVMLLANVLVGSWTKGSPDLVEAPHKDVTKMTRYDSTVDDADSPGIFCIFRDFQALPLYCAVLGWCWVTSCIRF